MAMPHIIFLQTVFLSLCAFITVNAETPFAVTSVGVVQGTDDSAPNGLPYFAFRGIPYAQPPTGNLRWKLPEPYPRFRSVYEATEFKLGCPQETRKANTSEDCLFLDVYVPHNVTSLYHNATHALEVSANATDSSPSTGGSKPVMIWIHGGAYHAGYGKQFAAWKLATEQDIVVVVVQYRLGALGFLSTGDETLPGNYGLWDQRLAMMWVKDNIRGFGGDVTMVTIAGESAGATSVSQHTISRQSSGLFQRAIMMSGTAEASWCFSKQPRSVFDHLAANTGCNDTVATAETRLECLMKKSADEIHRAAVITEGGNFVTFVPNVDGNFFPDVAQTLLNDQTYLASIGFNDYDFLLGVLNNEGVITFGTLLSMIPSLMTTGRIPYETIDNALLDLLLVPEFADGFSEDVKDVVDNRYFYPRDSAKSSLPAQHVFDLNTDASFTVPALKYLRHRVGDGSSSASSSRSYLYYFDWEPSLTKGTLFEGMPHGLDVDYLLGLTNDSLMLYGEIPLGGSITSQEFQVSRKYGDMIGAFVRTGDPNNGIPQSLKGHWQPYDASNETFLRFGQSSSIDYHLHASTASLWIDLLPRLQSRWLQARANENQVTSEKLTDFGVTESQANALILSLVVICAVLIIFNGVVSVALIGVCRRKNVNTYQMGKSEKNNKNMDKF